MSYINNITFIVILMLLCGNYQSTPFDVCTSSRQLVFGITKSLNFLQNNYKDINLDGFVGFELLKEFIGSILESNVSDKCNITKDVDLIRGRLLNINKLSLKEILLHDPRYFKHLKTAIYKVISFKSIWSRLDRNVSVIRKSRDQSSSYKEDQGDDCFNEIAERNCNISDKCSRIFLSNDTGKFYVATHTALYLIIYKQMNCATHSQSKLSDASLIKRINDVCLGIYEENLSFLKSKPTVVAADLDIFFERIVICGGKLGFEDFFSEEVFKVMINSQDRSDGCFRENAYLDNYESEEESSYSMNKRIHLNKRRDSVMKDGCGSHLLGLGAAGYGAYLKYLQDRYHMKN